MAIVVKLEALMLQHGISLDKIAAATGITNVNVSRLKTGKVVAYRGTTIDALIKVPKNLHHMSNPYSDAARAKLRGEGGPKTQ